MRSRNHIINRYKIILWITGLILFGIVIADAFNYFSDFNIIHSGLRSKISKLFHRGTILGIFLIGNYQPKIPFYFFFLFFFTFSTLLAIYKTSKRKAEKFCSSGLILILFLVLIVLNEYGVYAKWHTRYFDQADAFYQVQKWAKESTQTDALFLIDPNHQKAWEEFSERSSFGTFRQWLHTSIIAVENSQILEEGLRRTRLINKEITMQFLTTKTEDIDSHNRFELRRMIKNSFYSMNSKQFKELAKTNEIDYIILLKSFHKKSFTDLIIAYENKYYIVYKII